METNESTDEKRKPYFLILVPGMPGYKKKGITVVTYVPVRGRYIEASLPGSRLGRGILTKWDTQEDARRDMSVAGYVELESQGDAMRLMMNGRL